ncbi:MAG: hypothetical protein C5B51_32170 [Terriglobia bacterium]|nr:MAG: hypothetical protein C5B51_32170 [Terriglobia bacterium]
MKASFSLLLAGTLLPIAAFAQWSHLKTAGIPRLANGMPNLSAPAPHTADGKPDLNGIWQAGRAGAGGQYGYDYNVAQELPPDALTSWAKALRQQRVQDFRKDSPLARCLPVSVPFLNFRGLSKIVQTPDLIVILYESPNSPHRMIFMDGRELPKDPSPTWLGYSVGHWEGDTLVVNSVGFNDLGWLDVGGNPQTESLRLTERYRRSDFGHLQTEFTFDDPKTFTRPFTLRMEKTYTADTEIIEDVCENERDSRHLTGGVKVSPENLAAYAGIYELAGRDVEVAISGDQVMVKDGTHPKDQLFVARSQTVFMSSVSEVSVEFVKNGQGAVTHFTRTDGDKNERAVRKSVAAQR